MIKAVRIDERLIHGQVAMTWTKSLNLTGMVVASDEAATNDIQKMTLKMAAPSNVKVIIKTVDDAIKLLKDPRANEMRLMVLVPNVKDAVKVAKAFPTEIELMNVGNAGKMTPPSEDKKTLSKEVMLTDSEIQDLKELVELYPDTVFQPTPAMEKRSAKSVLSDF
ncbi:PTS sugar transporter subunit IIB [Enterococcus raffinosus]|uniref:PTS sugar transporter subunit IIB n=1 Tax=Enterococcus raffinosus TaxID=71452 RepID=A0AAW8TBD2_9ENTE|nr:PTS sugar transporter subunit IIB [Enterococcus raffinosus]MDT2524365.1 PTS sugar transporter subunit IIB [Enterococcus raffinosus]MDT2530500.1 PTS sugar transporter subunit IIB [Enterococcus raffinosus]MDT2535298.1 PTS sugar transporter subunit IIB [Enterococcus raffinosus]MDT2545150.1 PTS sugar transporter subunit IIB [Enterococcus raffinosus]MDT2578763.1 PTS sugar transporter subunit IIB [Enterococcus raffinosus]